MSSIDRNVCNIDYMQLDTTSTNNMLSTLEFLRNDGDTSTEMFVVNSDNDIMPAVMPTSNSTWWWEEFISTK